MKEKSGVIKLCFPFRTYLLSKYFIFNEKKEGEYQHYNGNGQLCDLYNYINDNSEGECKSYYKNGQLIVIYNYINGLIKN